MGCQGIKRTGEYKYLFKNSEECVGSCCSLLDLSHVFEYMEQGMLCYFKTFSALDPCCNTLWYVYRITVCSESFKGSLGRELGLIAGWGPGVMSHDIWQHCSLLSECGSSAATRSRVIICRHAHTLTMSLIYRRPSRTQQDMTTRQPWDPYAHSAPDLTRLLIMQLPVTVMSRCCLALSTICWLSRRSLVHLNMSARRKLIKMQWVK